MKLCGVEGRKEGEKRSKKKGAVDWLSRGVGQAGSRAQGKASGLHLAAAKRRGTAQADCESTRPATPIGRSIERTREQSRLTYLSVHRQRCLPEQNQLVLFLAYANVGLVGWSKES